MFVIPSTYADKTDFASWQQRIRLYYRGKENGVNILKSIDEEPQFQMVTTRDIWDNVKMLLEGSKLTKEDRESQLYDDFEHFRQNKGETIHDYYVRQLCGALEREWGMLIQVKLGRLSATTASEMLLMQAQENGVVLDEEQLLFLSGGQDNAIDEDVDEQPVQDLALNVDNVFQADDCDAYDSDVDEAPTAQTMFMAN
ncbi:hypothetical protein Tco_0991655 [Tanacetum coccineum]|uniref:Integrase, catalytic region, zinc finger, CCHC-type, peptidase aspartic, catalytic n=1 Tax=Tanacetum coccineum TaxID=301880 RepID=A0ABQ5EZV0_9ASTR